MVPEKCRCGRRSSCSGWEEVFATLTAAKACRSRKWARSTRNLARLDWLKRHRNFDTPYACRGHKSNSRGGERLTITILINSRGKVVGQASIRFHSPVVRQPRNHEGKPTLQHCSITLPNLDFFLELLPTG